jgi:hypothetical protein
MRKWFSFFTPAVSASAQSDRKTKTYRFSIGVAEQWFQTARWVGIRTVFAGAALLLLLATSQVAVNGVLNLFNREIAGRFARGVIHSAPRDNEKR